MLIAAFGVLGLAVGSFLNVVIDRLPREQSLLHPASHCEACGSRLAPRDLVPVFSYLWLRGRCRRCRARISPRLPLVELSTGLVFAFLYWHFGPGLQLAIALVYACMLSIIFVVDLEHHLVLDKVTFPGMALALSGSALWPGVGVGRALLGGGVGLAALALPFLISRQGMGLGDVKMGALMGLMTGFPWVLVALMMAVIGGGLLAAVLLALRLRGRHDPLPFATFLSAATLVVLVWGPTILKWYLT